MNRILGEMEINYFGKPGGDDLQARIVELEAETMEGGRKRDYRDTAGPTTHDRRDSPEPPAKLTKLEKKDSRAMKPNHLVRSVCPSPSFRAPTSTIQPNPIRAARSTNSRSSMVSSISSSASFASKPKAGIVFGVGTRGPKTPETSDEEDHALSPPAPTIPATETDENGAASTKGERKDGHPETSDEKDHALTSPAPTSPTTAETDENPAASRKGNRKDEEGEREDATNVDNKGYAKALAELYSILGKGAGVDDAEKQASLAKAFRRCIADISEVLKGGEGGCHAEELECSKSADDRAR